MAFRLRHRATFDPLSVTHSLKLRAPRLKAPDQWHWAWPLHRSTDAEAAVPISPVRHVWVSAIRVVAVSDDATAVAFVSHTGTVALATRDAGDVLSTAVEIVASPVVDRRVTEWCVNASSIVFFDLVPHASASPRKLLAVGYHSGAIAIFDVTTATLMTVTRPHQAPVRRLRFYPIFHLLPEADPYPSTSTNSGLLAVFGWSGAIARMSIADLLPLLTNPPTLDPQGVRWLVWNLSAQDAVLDAVVCGTDPSSICEMDVTTLAAPLRITAVGVNPPIAAYSVTSDPAFSARAAAKRAATSVLSAAKGFLLSRIGSSEMEPAPSAEEPTSPVTGVVRHSTSWADDPSSVHGVINFGDVRDTARKSVKAVLDRGRRFSESDSGSMAKQQSRDSGSWGGFKFRNALRDSHNSLGSHIVSEEAASAKSLEQHILMRQRSRFDGDAAKHAERLPQNARIVERLSAAPLPCSLVATCDTLGRVFVQDARDFCVLRVLKGYRDAQVAWLAEGGPLLVVYAARLNVLEVHGALDQKRKEAFRLVPGSMIAQSASHRVFSISPEGQLYELMRTRKGQPASADGVGDQVAIKESAAENQPLKDERPSKLAEADLKPIENDSDRANDDLAPDYELVGAFMEAVKTGHMSQAIDCLQRVEHDGYKVAHLMATLVTCIAHTSSEVHVALSSKASQIASKLKNPNLLSRFEAHRKLAEAFDLLASDSPSNGLPEEYTESIKDGKRLLDDDLGAELGAFVLSEQSPGKKKPRVPGKRVKMNEADTELINCERFILSHALAPTVDLHADVDFELQPRSDLSNEEQIWLSKAYFFKLLDANSVNTSTPGREHPTTVEVFLALTEFIGLTEADVARHFVQFFLHAPLRLLLNTRVTMHASPLRCAVARLRSRFPKGIVDPILIDGCETTSCIPNAVLLTRLCAVDEARSDSEEDTNPFLESLDRMGEVLLYRKMIAGSRVPPEVYEKFTARMCTGVPGDAERHSIATLIAANDFERASKILTGLEISRKLENLDWHESASISEAALHACRKKAATLLTDDSDKVIPKSVLTWILAAQEEKTAERTSPVIPDRLTYLQEIRAVLLNAQQHIPDSSVDAVRCLQLAEVMSTLIAQEKGELSPVAPVVSQDLTDMDIAFVREKQSDMKSSPDTATEPVCAENQDVACQHKTLEADGKDVTMQSPSDAPKEDHVEIEIAKSAKHDAHVMNAEADDLE